MNGIFVAAILTSGLALVMVGGAIGKIRASADWRLLCLAALVALPLQPLAFYLVRVPLDHWLVGQLGGGSVLYQWLISFYAPLTEEPAKLVPLLIPAIRRNITPANFVRYALAIGLGFAVGEMWFIAERVSRDAGLAALPFYQFSGYVVERLMVCVFHSAFVSVALWRLRQGFVYGEVIAMALHWLGNFPLVLMTWNFGGLGKADWSVLVQVWLLVYFLCALGLLSFFVFGRSSPGRIFFGRRRCPECAAEYDAPLLGFNFGFKRYERCPQCRKWHWTRSKVE